MMRLPVLFIALAAALNALANTNVKSELSAATVCETRVIDAIKGTTFVRESGDLQAIDCSVVPFKKVNYAVALLVFNHPSLGMQSLVAVFKSDFLNTHSKPVASSATEGMDTFPVKVNGKRQLLFVLQEGSSPKLSVYINAQSGPHTTRMLRVHLNLAASTVKWDDSFSHPMEAGMMPEIGPKSGGWVMRLGGATLDLIRDQVDQRRPADTK